MKNLLYLTIFSLLFVQCKEPKTAEAIVPGNDFAIKAFAIDGISAENIRIFPNVVVIHLPDNYTGGNFIKPKITVGKGYKITANLLDGFAFEGENIDLTIEKSQDSGSVNYKVVVIPPAPITLAGSMNDLDVTIDPEVKIKLPVKFRGTSITANEKGDIVEFPSVVLTDKSGISSQTFPAGISTDNGASELVIPLPVTANAGEYTATLEWGTKKTVLSGHILLRAGEPKIFNGNWWIGPEDQTFKVYGFNLNAANKYQLVLNNETVKNLLLPLNVQDAGVLTGIIPGDLAAGNYTVKYLINEKQVAGYGNESGKLAGYDKFFKRKSATQPVLLMVTKAANRKSTQVSGYLVDYYEPTTNISGNEELLVSVKRVGGYLGKDNLKLVNTLTRREYDLKTSGVSHSIMDGYVAFFSYRITPDVQPGNYELYISTSENGELSERYGDIISIN